MRTYALERDIERLQSRMTSVEEDYADAEKSLEAVRADLRAAEGRVEELEAKLRAAGARAADEERQRTEAITRICGAFGITSALQLAAIAERDDETTLDLVVKLINRVHAAEKAAESRAARLQEALEEIEGKTGHFGEAPPPPEWMPMLSLIAWVGRTARAAIAAEEGK